ncbi:hypothetical protein [Paenibacillus guangzhouensis]|uniref:hypothetical protein n=1 Tax=Paenibacillus guangzhouensis TaxID=1473112 RepID=UPI001266ACC7|nr:hypothetical protein [Paenibacillus guangzhouensis]
MEVCIAPDTRNPFEKSIDSFKEIGQDLYDAAVERNEKKWDSTYDFFNYLTSGISGGIITGAEDRAVKMWDSPYRFINWLTIGIPDTVKWTFAPEDALSKEHWLSSISLVGMIAGGYASAAKPGAVIKPIYDGPSVPKADGKILGTRYAKPTDLFKEDTFAPFGQRIAPKNLYREMNKSNVGKETLGLLPKYRFYVTSNGSIMVRYYHV